MASTITKTLILIGIIVGCLIWIFSSKEVENPYTKPTDVYNLKMIKKWETQGIHCYVFIMGNDTLIAYSESDINRQQQ